MNKPETLEIRSPDGSTTGPIPVGALQKLAAASEPRSRRKSAMPWTDVAVCIGQLDPQGNRQETVHQIDTTDGDIRITSVKHEVVEKQRQCKEDGQLVGFEPTGEYELTIRVKYVKD